MPEGKMLEFKRDISSPKNILKTLVAFANTAGGRLVIGVEDGSKEVLGVENPLDEEERICNLIAKSIFLMPGSNVVVLLAQQRASFLIILRSMSTSLLLLNV